MVSTMVAGTALLATGLYVVSTKAVSPAQKAATSRPPQASRLTATVEIKQPAERIALRGKVTREGTRQVVVKGKSPGEQVVTKLYLDPQRPFQAPALIADVSGKPIVALVGDFPLYRDIALKDSGPDVAQLQKALLGYGPGCRVTGTYDACTAAAKNALMARLGITSTRAAKGTTGVSQSDIVFVPAGRLAVDKTHVKVGDTLNGPLLTVSYGEARVTADIPESMTDAANQWQPGSPATMRGANGQVTLKLHRVQRAAAAATNATGPTGSPEGGKERPNEGQSDNDTPQAVLTGPSGELTAAGTGQFPVTLTVKTAPRPELTVPVSAIWTDPSGARYLRRVINEESDEKIPLLTAENWGGWVQVTPTTPGTLKEGDSVLVGYQDQGASSP
ncbi:peptidoglycan-binding protein [Austwickia sp. TVS 96-490-7B]|uniref:peptidoglycan-binding domain-containing protein n=1 Tax=Austwickia sp. TVS 96-490-7B TaxID=2830843 RepID=UPI001C596F08|nr:hypothetical protein [Austwickia sp. TVS 96-490-7B]